MAMKKSEGRKKKGSWKFQNPENLKQMERNGCVWKWCSNDCHSCTMWCLRENCMNYKAYKKMKENNESKGSEKKIKITKDFKVALSALVSEDKYKAFEENFLK
eukprot:445793-Ditylum_brightwellii.AAC.1